MKKTFKWLAIVAVSCLLIYGILFYQNNHSNGSIDHASIETSLNQSKDWILANESKLLRIHNPALWQMMRKLEQRSPDARIAKLVKKYQDVARSSYRGTGLEFQVYDTTTVNYATLDLSPYPDYNLLFMYGHRCDEHLAQNTLVQEQLLETFCDTHHALSPACKTHQLMGFLPMRQSQCIAPSKITATIDHLTHDIERQLKFDVRVVDVYLQRVLMLFEAGQPEAVRGSWLHRIIQNQNADGGWGDFDALIPLPGGYRFGFSARAFEVSAEKSYFHTTAQGALLLTYALENSQVVDLN